MRITACLLTCILCNLVMLTIPRSALANDSTTPIPLEILTDHAHLTIEAVCCNESLPFKTDQMKATPGLGSDALWIRLPIIPAEQILRLSHIVDRAELFEFDQRSRLWTSTVVGDSTADPDVLNREQPTAFELVPYHLATERRYIKLNQPTYLRIQFFVETPSKHAHQKSNHLQSSLFVIGFIVAIVLFNLVLGIITANPTFAFNALTIINLVGMSLYFSGYGARAIWPIAWSNNLLNIFLACTILFGGAFLSSMLAPGPASAFNPTVLRKPGYLAIIVLLFSPVLPYWLIQTLLLLVMLVFMIVASIVVINHIKHGNRNAIPLTVPLFFVMVPGGLIVYLLKSGVVNQSVLKNLELEYLLAFEALAFSVVLGTRLRTLGRDAENNREKIKTFQLESARKFSKLQNLERARIAADLHDSIGHDLVIMKSLLQRHDKSSGVVEKAEQQCTHTLRTVRRLSHELHPTLVELAGWEHAVNELLDNLAHSTGIKVRYSGIAGNLPLLKESQSHLYIILQELITNVAKHAEATTVEVTTRIHQDILELVIQDNGIGTDRETLKSGGLGYISIDQRTLALGGNWKTQRITPSGTKVTVGIPIHGGENYETN